MSLLTNVRNEESQVRGPVPGAAMPGFLTRLAERPRRLWQFLHEVRVEMKHVHWPTWIDVRATTVVVIITVVLFSLYFLAIDSGVARLVDLIRQKVRG